MTDDMERRTNEDGDKSWKSHRQKIQKNPSPLFFPFSPLSYRRHSRKVVPFFVALASGYTGASKAMIQNMVQTMQQYNCGRVLLILIICGVAAEAEQGFMQRRSDGHFLTCTSE